MHSLQPSPNHPKSQGLQARQTSGLLPWAHSPDHGGKAKMGTFIVDEKEYQKLAAHLYSYLRSL